MIGTGPNLSEIRAALLGRLEELGEQMLGTPNPETRRRKEWGWSGTGGAFLVVRGPKRGAFYCHADGQGGGPLDLIMFARSCTFAEAVRWAKSWLGLDEGAPVPPIDPTILLERARKRAEADAKVDAEGRGRSDIARAIWDHSIAVTETIAAVYLNATRCIPTPAGDWPDAVRFHPGSNSLIVAATDDEGEVRAIQRVHLTPDAQKITKDEAKARGLPSVKVTNGVKADAAVRLSGSSDGPLLLCEGPETGLSVWAATGYETHILLGSVANATFPDGRRCVICREDDADGSPAAVRMEVRIVEWREAGIDVVSAWPWPERRGDKSDLNDTIKAGGPDAVRAQVAAAVALASDVPHGPHYPRPTLSGPDASEALLSGMRGWLDAAEFKLAIENWIEEEAVRTLVEVRQRTEGRILAKRLRSGVDRDEAEADASVRAWKAAPRVAKRQARTAARKKFGAAAVSQRMPRLQIKGAAGLGKTRAFVTEYLNRPALWGRQIYFYAPYLDLCAEVAAAVSEGAAAAVAKATAAGTLPADGSLPRAIVIFGRKAAGCHEKRLPIVEAAQKAGVDSVYRTVCHTPAVGSAPESFCPFYKGCGYIDQFADQGPALRILPHVRLKLRQPDELQMPAPDFVVVDESAISTLTSSIQIDPALLTADGTFAAEIGKEDELQEAYDTAHAVATAIAEPDAVARLVTDGVTPKQLRHASDAAALASAKARPGVWAGMDAQRAMDRLTKHQRHEGRAVAAVLSQLARDIEAGRTASVGIEWDAKHTATMEDGTQVAHPIIRRHGIEITYGAPSGLALLLLDADADLEINQRLFGANIEELDVPAVRVARVFQVNDFAVSKTSLAPPKSLPNNIPKSKGMRDKFAAMVRRESRNNRRVLVVAPKSVRRALTGELGVMDPWTSWEGAEITHFGRILGSNRWAAFDTVIIISREQPPALDIERTARAIWGDAPEVALTLPGVFARKGRRHDLRTGEARPVIVQEHADPRVQRVLELSRERQMGQALDRLRLIHRAEADAGRVLVASNLPIPGLTVDTLMSLDDMLAGGTVWERAMARMAGGVLPLSPDWLVKNMSDLFPSRRTAAREAAACSLFTPVFVSSSIVPVGNRNLYCRLALLRTAAKTGAKHEQTRPSKALIRSDAIDPRAELGRLLGAEVVEFRFVDQPAAEPPAPETEADVPVWNPPGLGGHVPVWNPPAVTVDPAIVPDIAVARVGDVACRVDGVAVPEAPAAKSNAIAAMAVAGLVLSNPRHALLVFPALFTSYEAARKAIQRAGDFPGSSALVSDDAWTRVEYQLAGARQHPAVGYASDARVVGLQIELAEKLGPLARFDVVPMEAQAQSAQPAAEAPPAPTAEPTSEPVPEEQPVAQLQPDAPPAPTPAKAPLPVEIWTAPEDPALEEARAALAAMGAEGLALLDPDHAFLIFEGMFASCDAARKALRWAGDVPMSPSVVSDDHWAYRIDYQVADAGQRPAVGYGSGARVINLRFELTSRLGLLAWFRIIPMDVPATTPEQSAQPQPANDDREFWRKHCAASTCIGIRYDLVAITRL